MQDGRVAARVWIGRDKCYGPERGDRFPGLSSQDSWGPSGQLSTGKVAEFLDSLTGLSSVLSSQNSSGRSGLVTNNYALQTAVELFPGSNQAEKEREKIETFSEAFHVQ